MATQQDANIDPDDYVSDDGNVDMAGLRKALKTLGRELAAARSELAERNTEVRDVQVTERLKKAGIPDSPKIRKLIGDNDLDEWFDEYSDVFSTKPAGDDEENPDDDAANGKPAAEQTDEEKRQKDTLSDAQPPSNPTGKNPAERVRNARAADPEEAKRIVKQEFAAAFAGFGDE